MSPVAIGLRGFSPRNLGSHLMAHAVIAHFPTSRTAVPLRAAAGRIDEVLADSGVWLWSEAGGNPALHRWSAPAFELSGRKAVVGRRVLEVDAIADISGYLYGDPFGPGPVHRLADWARRWRRRGIPMVLFPQSIGPFARQQERDTFRRALADVDVIVARDDHSEGVLAALDPECLVLRSPDLAIESSRLAQVPGPGIDGPYALLLPNRQVIRKLGTSESEYLMLFQQAAIQLAAAGLRVVVAAHERGSDDALCQAVAGDGDRATVRHVGNALEMVSLVRGASLIVSSRYHGLVAGLSNQVPGIAVGWADKYDDLLSEFGVPELSLALDGATDPARVLSGTVTDVLDDLDGLSARLRVRTTGLQAELDAMWSVVTPILAGESRRARA